MLMIHILCDHALLNQFESGYFRSTNYSSSRTLCFTLSLHKYIDMHDGMSQFDSNLGSVLLQKGWFSGRCFHSGTKM